MRCYSSMLIIVVCVGMSACLALAEENAVKGGTIRGKITDQTPKQNPIEGVKINIIASNKKGFTVKTDANGEHKRTGLPAGRYFINISKKGYYPRNRKPVTVINGNDHFYEIKLRQKDDREKRFTEDLLQHVAEDIGKRYKLDASIVKELRQSILQALNTVMEEKNQELKDFAKIEEYNSIALIIAMLSHPDCKSAFAKYMTETQIQDYTNFTKARQQQVRQAVVNIMTAFLDQALSLTVKQREDLGKLLLDIISENQGLPLMGGIMNGPLPKEVGDLLHNKLHISLDSVLNQTQSKIWEVMIDFYDEKG